VAIGKKQKSPSLVGPSTLPPIVIDRADRQVERNVSLRSRGRGSQEHSRQPAKGNGEGRNSLPLTGPPHSPKSLSAEPIGELTRMSWRRRRTWHPDEKARYAAILIPPCGRRIPHLLNRANTKGLRRLRLIRSDLIGPSDSWNRRFQSAEMTA